MFFHPLLVILAAAAPTLAFFRLPCDNVLVRERVDPIVSPGQIAAHLHTVSGGSGFSLTSTYDDMRKSACTSCHAKADLSAYWTPTLHFAWANGSYKTVEQVGGGLVYYLQRYHPSDQTKVLAFPKGFKMLAGSPFRRTYNASSLVDQAIGWNCLGATGVKETRVPELPKQNCPAIRFPSCWSGKSVYEADQSHMAYPAGESGPCPATHPKRVVTLFYEMMWYVQAFGDVWHLAKDPKSPFVLCNGDPIGYGYHGDFLNGWDVDILQKAMDTCTSDSGVIEECKVLELYDRKTEGDCRKTPDIDEVVGGTLKALPGCNPITETAAAAKAAPSTGPNLATPKLFKNTTTYTSKYAPPGSLVSKDMPYTVTSHNGYKYQGCWSYEGTRTLSQSPSPGSKSVAACLGAARAAGYTYVGLEYGGECWAGNELANGAKSDHGKCDMVCTGGPLNVCGGSNALSLYKLSRSTSSRTKRHVPSGHA